MAAGESGTSWSSSYYSHERNHELRHSYIYDMYAICAYQRAQTPLLQEGHLIHPSYPTSLAPK